MLLSVASFLFYFFFFLGGEVLFCLLLFSVLVCFCFCCCFVLFCFGGVSFDFFSFFFREGRKREGGRGGVTNVKNFAHGNRPSRTVEI